MKHLQAMLMADFYKLSHREQYPEGTEYVYSTWTPRASKMKGIDKVVAFGFQGFIQEYLIDFFNKNFFSRNINDIVWDYERVVTNTLGIKNPPVDHIRALHALQFLPLDIKAVPEGTLVPIRCPMLTIQNTDPRFFWLTNFLETLMSSCLWGPTTSATIACNYRKLLDYWAEQTGGPKDFVQFQGHDFSMRGMSSVEAACRSGAGHLLSFVGTDTIPAITYLEEYYGADVTKELVGTSIPATEHSVMCAYGNDDASFKRLITEIYPNGLLSVVSDTWNLWEVLTNILPRYRAEVLARDGKLVIRPDSGDPVDIICGKARALNEPESKGVVELLWDIFGGKVNDKGYRELDPHIGVIYGDSISLERASAISCRLAAKGFASTNVIYGIGSFTYQYNTRDTFGFALKSTACVINGVEKHIFKDPITDDGTKKSQKGRVVVTMVDNEIIYLDSLPLATVVPYDMLLPLFKDGTLVRKDSLRLIRERLANQPK
jgi:nicotinamide phosphoribosyltransferase